MGRQIDYVVGKIEDLEDDRQAGWEAFYKKDYENEALREEIAKLKAEIRRLKSGSKKSR
jgi:cell division protein FtsB